MRKFNLSLEVLNSIVTRLMAVLIGALVIYFFILAPNADSKEVTLDFTIFAVSSIVLCIILFLAPGFPLYWFGLLGKFLYRTNCYFFKNTNRVKFFNEAMLFVSWKEIIGKTKKLPDLKIYCNQTFNMQLRPITKNPKVRFLDYTISTNLIKTKQSVEKMFNKFGYWSDGCPRIKYEEIRKKIREILYDFNEQNSRQLSNFFNPDRDEQQQKFYTMLKKYLNPKLSKWGLEVSSAKFAL